MVTEVRGADDFISRKAGLAHPARKPRILLALAGWEQPMDATKWAIELARPLGAELYALRVLPDRPRGSRRPQAPGARAEAENGAFVVDPSDAAEQQTLQVFHGLQARVHVLTRRGEFERKVRKLAAALQPTLVVVSPYAAERAIVTRLAHIARVPVLVAQRLCRGGPVLAATDLEDLRYPILRYARDAARWIGAPLVFLHNVALQEFASGGTSAELAARMPLMERAADLLEVPADIVLRSSASAQSAIVDTARRRGADVIVVGTRGTASEGPGATVPERVLRDARQSLLLVPLQDRRFGRVPETMLPAAGPWRRVSNGEN